MGFDVQCRACRGQLTIPDELWEKRFAGRVQSLKCRKCGERIRVDARPEGEPAPKSDVNPVQRAPLDTPPAEGRRFNLPKQPLPPAPSTASDDRSPTRPEVPAAKPLVIESFASSKSSAARVVPVPRPAVAAGKPAQSKPQPIEPPPAKHKQADSTAVGSDGGPKPEAQAQAEPKPTEAERSGSAGSSSTESKPKEPARAEPLRAAPGAAATSEATDEATSEQQSAPVAAREATLSEESDRARGESDPVSDAPAIVDNSELLDDDEDDELYTRDTLVRSSWTASARVSSNPSKQPEQAVDRSSNLQVHPDSHAGATLEGAAAESPRPTRSKLGRLAGVATAAGAVAALLVVVLRPDASNDAPAIEQEPRSEHVSAGGDPVGEGVVQPPPEEPANVPDVQVADEPAGEGSLPVAANVAEPSDEEPATDTAAPEVNDTGPLPDERDTVLLGTAGDDLEKQVDRLVEHVMTCHIMGRSIGTATMRITIKPTGRVTHVSVVGDPIERRPVATCVKVRGLATRFAPFDGPDSITISRELTFGDIPRAPKRNPSSAGAAPPVVE